MTHKDVVLSLRMKCLSAVLSCDTIHYDRAWNNGRSTDNVRSESSIVRANPWMTGHVVRSFGLSKKIQFWDNHDGNLFNLIMFPKKILTRGTFVCEIDDISCCQSRSQLWASSANRRPNQRARKQYNSRDPAKRLKVLIEQDDSSPEESYDTDDNEENELIKELEDLE